MKIDFVVDTNILIYILEGKESVFTFLDFQLGISFITEIELLGRSLISKSEEQNIKALIDSCFLIDWNSKIKDVTILLKKKYKVKLPDAIIAATSIVLNKPLLTADKGFLQIN